jgi:hypothetical protein
LAWVWPGRILIVGAKMGWSRVPWLSWVRHGRGTGGAEPICGRPAQQNESILSSLATGYPHRRTTWNGLALVVRLRRTGSAGPGRTTSSQGTRLQPLFARTAHNLRDRQAPTGCIRPSAIPRFSTPYPCLRPGASSIRRGGYLVEAPSCGGGRNAKPGGNTPTQVYFPFAVTRRAKSGWQYPKAEVVPARPRRMQGNAEGCEARPDRAGIHRAGRAMEDRGTRFGRPSGAAEPTGHFPPGRAPWHSLCRGCCLRTFHRAGTPGPALTISPEGCRPRR